MLLDQFILSSIRHIQESYRYSSIRSRQAAVLSNTNYCLSRFITVKNTFDAYIGQKCPIFEGWWIEFWISEDDQETGSFREAL
jgi:hypothetical protein